MPKFPEWIPPMAATLTQERFTGSEWIFERKFDGIRLLAYKRGAKVELFSRNRLSQNIPALVRAIAQLPHRHRHPRLLAVRMDKDPGEVVRELPKKSEVGECSLLMLTIFYKLRSSGCS